MNIRARFKNKVNGFRRWMRAKRRPSGIENRRLLEQRGEDLNAFRIREAGPADVAALGQLHAQTWAETYRTGPARAGARERVIEEGKWRARQWADLFAKRGERKAEVGDGGSQGPGVGGGERQWAGAGEQMAGVAGQRREGIGEQRRVGIGGQLDVGGDWFILLVENAGGRMVGFAKGQRYANEDLPDYNGELNKIYLLREYQGLGLGKKLICAVAARLLEMDVPNMLLFGIAENPSCGFHEAMGGQRLYTWKGEFHGGYGWRDLRKVVAACVEEKEEEAG